MKRSFLVSLSWSNRNSNGFMNVTVNFENCGFRQSNIKEVQESCEEQLLKRYGEESTAVVLNVIELEPEE